MRLLPILVLCLLLAGCAQPTVLESCSGTRDHFHGEIPGLHAQMTSSQALAAELVERRLGPLPVTVELPWEGAHAAVLHAQIAPIIHEDGEISPDLTGGGVGVELHDSRLQYWASFFETTPEPERIALVERFLANVTDAPPADTKALARTIVDSAEIRQGSNGREGQPLTLSPAPIVLTSQATTSPPPIVATMPLRWPSPIDRDTPPAYAGVGQRGYLLGDIWMIVDLPVLESRGSLGNLSYGLRADESDHAELTVASFGHEPSDAQRVRDAVMASMGRNSTALQHNSRYLDQPVDYWMHCS